MMIRKLFIIALGVLLMCSVSVAKEIGGANLPDTAMAGNKNLVLNGAGLRKKTFVKVYAAGLYLEQKSNDAKKITEADQSMAIKMHFIYDGVSNKKLIKAWNNGFKSATGGNIAPLKEKIDKFNSFFTEEAKKGDVYDIIYIPARGINVHMKGKHVGTIKGLDFKKAVFGIWLSEKPADKGLKKGMLGK